MTPPPACRTRAVVVGIGQYGEPSWDIDGPALDACRMAQWLTRCGVPPEQVTVLVSPQEGNEAVRRLGLNTRPADRETVYRVFSKELPKEPADMLFVYWVGHGMTYKDDTLLAFADTSSAWHRYLNVSHLLLWLRTTAVGYPRQAVLVDACRTYAEKLNLITAPNCWNFDPAPPAANRSQQALLAVPRGEPSILPPGSNSTLFTTALHTELGTSGGPCQLDVPVLRDRIRAHPGSQLPVALIYEGPLGEHEEYVLGAPDGEIRHAGPKGPTGQSEAQSELIRRLSAIESMRYVDLRVKFAEELTVAFDHGMFDRTPNPSSIEIAKAVTRMAGWPRTLREVCAFRRDLFPEHEQAVIDLIAFLDLLSARGGRL